MRQLHVVALSEDGRYVLLAPNRDATKGAFRVAVDSRLSAALRGDLPRPGQENGPASDLTPKDIQARLRAGESVDEIARSAGVPAARVERFAGPVVSERARMVDAARAAALSRPRRGQSAVPLGRAVDAHLVESSVDLHEVVWTARRQDDGAWLVEAAFTARGRRKKAGWRYDHHTRELTPADASSAVLGYVDPPDGRRPGKVVAAVKPKASRRPRSRTTGATSSGRRSGAAAKAPAKRAKAPAAKATPAKKAPVAKPTARKNAPVTTATTARGSKATTPKAIKPKVIKPKVTKPKVTKKTTAVKPAKARAPRAPAAKAARTPAKASKPPTKKAKPAAEGPAQQSPPQLRVVPPVDETARVRATVPGWADVLLSTTPPSRASAAPEPDER